MVPRFGRRRRKGEQEPKEEPQASTTESEEAPGTAEDPQPAQASDSNEPAEAQVEEPETVADGPPPVESAAAGGDETPAEAVATPSQVSTAADGTTSDCLPLLSTLLRLHGAEDAASLADAAAQLARSHLDGTQLLLLLVDKGGSFRLQGVRSAATASLAEKLNDALGIDLLSQTPAPHQGRMARVWLEDSARAQVLSLADIWGGPAGEEACRRAETALGISQVTAVRLASPDEPLGIALFLSCDHSPDPAVLDAIGRHVTAALGNFRSIEKARQFGSIDPIRWIPDGKEFGRQLSREVSRARRYGQPLSVALLVMDNFDSLRLEYGWTVANRLLRSTSSALAECLRESDLLGSYRHNGFGVILIQTSAEAAQEATTRLREKAAAVRVLEGEGGPIPECLVAIAAHPEDGNDASALLVAAESRLLPKRRSSSASA